MACCRTEVKTVFCFSCFFILFLYMAHKKCPHKTFVCSQHLSWLSAQNYLRSSHNPLVAITWISMGAHKPPSTGNYTIVCRQAVEHTLGQPMKTEGGCPSGREFQNCHMQNSSPKGWVQSLPWPYNTHRQTSAHHHKKRNAEKEKEGGGGDSSVVRAPDSWLKGRGFESLLERRENFLLQGRLSVLTLISVSVPPPCYHSST